MRFRTVFEQMTKKKRFDEEEMKKTELARFLSTLDLTLLGVGSTLGVGIYVLTGEVAKYHAGPGVMISFFVAAVASTFAGLCYAEFGARVPRAGSAYAYCYFSVGEFVAFVIGWNLILEYTIGAASVTKGISSYIDELIGNHISEVLKTWMPINVDYMGDYPDFFAFAIVFCISVGLAFGMKESSIANNISTAINLSVIVFVTIAGSFKADIKNWTVSKENLPQDAEVGEGGYMPFGVIGVLKGAAICFYGFIGFDCIATMGEEAKTPQKSIPLSIFGSLAIIFLSYFSTSTVLTLMVPYYEQNPKAPISTAFDQFEWVAAKWAVSIGAIFSLFPSLLCSIIPLPRIIYAMSADGLLFKYMGRVNEKFHSPILGTFISAFLTGMMALLFNINQLVNMMSIGTLVAYSIVAACVLLLRYRKTDEDEGGDETCFTWKKLLLQLFNGNGLPRPTEFTSSLVSWMVLLFCILGFAAMICVTAFSGQILSGEPLAVFACALLLLLTGITAMSIGMQPKSKKTPFFTVPMVPSIPCLSILINFYLLLMLDYATWVRFVVWILLGMVMYFTYGIRHSKERLRMSPTTGNEMVSAATSKMDMMKSNTIH